MNGAVRLERISKSFGAVKALEDVSIEVQSQTMHAIVGENGAGKTTLMRILYGVLQPDDGSIILSGEPVRFSSATEAGKRGIGMVSQHYSIISELTCLQNLILGGEPSITMNCRELKERAQNLAEQNGFAFDWDAPAASLSPASKQRLEILKLLWRESKIMILDEPTAMLSPAGADSLFESMNRLIERGATVLLVTHRLPEVMQYCRRVSVMRAGRLVAESDVADTNPSTLAGMIMGSGALPQQLSEKSASPEGGPVLTAEKITVKGNRGHDAISELSLTLKAGEIVGLAGVDGNGQAELIQALAGLVPVASGAMRLLQSLDENSSTLERLRSGLRIVPEDRHSEGVIESWSLEDNASLGLETLPPLAKGPWIDANARRSFAEQTAEKFHTKHGGLNKPMASLSGGNQQRLVVGRALQLSPQILLAFQPVRGLDLGATARIYEAIREECGRGMAALVVSFDLDELLEHCDRILVLNGGRLFDPGEASRFDRDKIGRLMVGAA